MSSPNPSPLGEPVTTMARAVALRAGLIFGPLVVVIFMVAGMPGYKPLAFIVCFFGAFGLLYLVLSIRTDRKLRVDLGKPDAPWTGNYAAWIPVDADVSPDSALQIARSAVVQLRARDVKTIGNHTAVGWVGSIWTNLPRWQPYEVAVVIVPQPDGMTQLICCARPRFSLAYFGGAMSKEWAGRLQQAVTSRT